MQFYSNHATAAWDAEHRAQRCTRLLSFACNFLHDMDVNVCGRLCAVDAGPFGHSYAPCVYLRLQYAAMDTARWKRFTRNQLSYHTRSPLLQLVLVNYRSRKLQHNASALQVKSQQGVVNNMFIYNFCLLRHDTVL